MESLRASGPPGASAEFFWELRPPPPRAPPGSVRPLRAPSVKMSEDASLWGLPNVPILNDPFQNRGSTPLAPTPRAQEKRADSTRGPSTPPRVPASPQAHGGGLRLLRGLLSTRFTVGSPLRYMVDVLVYSAALSICGSTAQHRVSLVDSFGAASPSVLS